MQNALMAAADLWAEHWPAPTPSPDQAQRGLIIAHRGAHGPDAPENTLDAFARADAAGVWGLELDVRFTADHEPVVSHDRSLLRVFGVPSEISEVTLSALQRAAPAVPRLADVIALYGHRRHLMIEIKADGLPNPQAQAALAKTLRHLEPARDWHLLALRPENFAAAPFAPPEALVLVAEMQPNHFSSIAKQKNFGGLAGHFLMMTDTIRAACAAGDRKIGVGQIASRNALKRELARGADWLFTDRAVDVQTWLEAERSASRARKN
jgi:glycerophosphoryl diester phosphodiesterase